MAVIEIPSLLDIPEKIRVILTELDNYRYFLIEGGRGGGKSQSIARIFLYLAEHMRLRMVCGREIQNSIQESVYSLLTDLIHTHRLDFTISKTFIVNRGTNTQITFRGFREQGSFNIQGMEGVDVLWIDESQAITKQTLNVLIPTIRKNEAKIFFTMNRHVVNDPVFEFCSNREDCLHIHINFDDNKFCTEALKREAIECAKKSEEDYNHIWLGKPLDKSEDSVFAYDELVNTSINRYQLRQGYSYRIAGFDIARFGDDKSACVILQQMGALNWEVIHVEEWGHKDLNWTTGRILEIYKDMKIDRCIIDEDGIGAGPLDTLTKGRDLNTFTGFKNPAIAYADNKEYANPRTINTYVLKDLIRKGHLAMTDNALMKELCTLKYTFDHQQRKILISKDKMRKEGVKSPNMADALIMAASLIDEVKTEQGKSYGPVHGARQNQSDNLFQIAGVR